MTFRQAASAVAFSLVAAAGVAAAQSADMTNVTTNSSPTSFSSGSTGAVLGSVTIAANGGDLSVASVPITVTAANGGAVSDLTACQLYNASGTSLTTGSNAVSPSSGANTFSFDAPLLISNGQSAVVQLRCNVAANAQSGGTYQFTAGTPTFTQTSSGATASSGASLMANLNVSSAVKPGSQDTLFGLVTLSASQSNSSVQVASIPLSVSFAKGASVGDITDCRVRSLSNLANPLNNGGNAVGIVSGSNSIPLDSPLQIPARSAVTLALTCDVAATAPLGGQIMFSLTPGIIPATVSGSTTVVIPTAGVNSSGQPASTSGTVTYSNAVAARPTVPGIPNTGSDAAQNILVLALSAFVAIGGFFLARRLTVTV